MHRIAHLVDQWHHQRREGAVARVVASVGLGPQHRDEMLLVDPGGRTAGALLGGAAHQEVVAAARSLLTSGRRCALTAIAIDDGDAAAAGLTCGGAVDVLVQRLDSIPPDLWRSLGTRRPVALVTALDAPIDAVVVHPGGRLDGSFGRSGIDTLAQAEADALLERPGTIGGRLRAGDLELVIESWDPAPRLVVVGTSELAAALDRQADLVGWDTVVAITAADAVTAIDELHHADAVLVIDHDPFVATPVIAAALTRGVGYVGMLGSRRTQQRGREHLRDVGVPDQQLARLHGPAGLDIGGRSPAETAVSIVAEIIAVRAGRRGEPLTGSDGRISG